MIKLAENDNMDLIKYDVNLDEGYMELSETETFPYRSTEDILEDLK